jgi:hypothetical protein
MQPSQEQREAALKAGLDKALTQIKAQLPRKIDNATTLVDAVIEGATFSYYYMLDDTLAQPSRDLVRGKVCTSDMIKSMQIGARYRYVYTNLQGKPLAEFELGQDDCTKP